MKKQEENKQQIVANLIKILDELIADCVANNKKQGHEFYLGTKQSLQEENLSSEEIYNYWRSYSGYSAWGAFDDFDYPKIEQIIALWQQLLKCK